MKKNSLDDIFAAKLREHARQPRPEAWQKLEQRLPYTAKHRGVAWYWYATAAAGIAAITILFSVIKQEPSKVVTLSSISNKVNVTSIQHIANNGLPTTQNKTVVKAGQVTKMSIYEKTKEQQLIIVTPLTEKESFVVNSSNEPNIVAPQAIEKEAFVAKNEIMVNNTTSLPQAVVVMNIHEDDQTFISEAPTTLLPTTENKKQFRLGKFLKQLKEGEASIKDIKLIAKASEKIEAWQEKVNIR
jgi:hypothetical protein